MASQCPLPNAKDGGADGPSLNWGWGGGGVRLVITSLLWLNWEGVRLVITSLLRLSQEGTWL